MRAHAILVLQWPASSEADFEDLLRVEAELERSLEAPTIVDGHDFGAAEMNIFLETRDPARTFEEVRAILEQDARWDGVRAAFRVSDEDEYTVIWPPDAASFSVS